MAYIGLFYGYENKFPDAVHCIDEMPKQDVDYYKKQYRAREPKGTVEEEQWRNRFWNVMGGMEPIRPTLLPVKDTEATKNHWRRPVMGEPNMISFYNSERNLERGVRTKMRVGAYLTQFFPETKNINDVVARWNAEYAVPELKIARTGDEIERVYTTGPSSCMAGSAKSFFDNGTPQHPTRIYHESDIGIAYVERDGRVIARCMCWPDKKVYYQHIYGDNARMQRALAANGFKSVPNLYGARVRHVPAGKPGGYLAPAIDGHSYGILSEDGEWHTLTGDSRAKGARVVSSMGNVGAGRYCDYTNQWLDIGEFVMVDNKYWSKAKCEALGGICAKSGRFVPKEQIVEVDGKKWSQRAFKDLGFVCCGDGKNYDKKDSVPLKGRRYSRAFLETLVVRAEVPAKAVA